MSDVTPASSPAGLTREHAADDRLEALREELEQLVELPVSARVERFERANDLLARELAGLDEV